MRTLCTFGSTTTSATVAGADEEEEGAGGAAVSSVEVMDCGRLSIPCVYPVVMKSRCFWHAWRFVWMSDASSDPY